MATRAFCYLGSGVGLSSRDSVSEGVRPDAFSKLMLGMMIFDPASSGSRVANMIYKVGLD